MFGEPIEEAKKAMIEFIDKLKGDHGLYWIYVSF